MLKQCCSNRRESCSSKLITRMGTEPADTRFFNPKHNPPHCAVEDEELLMKLFIHDGILHARRDPGISKPWPIQHNKAAIIIDKNCRH